MKRRGIKTQLFFFKLMHFLGMTGMVWWLPTLFIYRATLHPLVLLITVKTPLVLVGIIALTLLYRFVKSRTTAGGRVASFLTSVGVITLIVFYGTPVYEYFSIVVNHNKRIKLHELSELPLTAFEKVHAKYTIHGVADHESVDDTKDVTLPHYVRLNDSLLYWTMEVEPSKTKWAQFLFEHPKEVFYTRAEEVSPRFDKKHNEVTPVDFEVGEFLWLSSNSKTAATKKLSFLQYFRYEAVDYIINLQDDQGEWVQVIPLIHWKGTLFPMPVFGGVIVVKQGRTPYFEKVLFGAGEFVSKDDVNNYNYLRGQSLVPTEVSLYIANTFRVYYSWKAPLPGNHEGDIRIPQMPNEYTHFPFQEFFRMSEVIPDSLKTVGYDGVYHYIPLEPYGDDKHVLSFSLFIRGTDGVHAFYYDHKKRGEKLVGATAVPAKVTDNNPDYDWNRARVTEMTPVIRKNADGKKGFWWKTSIQTTREQSKDNESDNPNVAKDEITFGKAELALLEASNPSIYVHLSGFDTDPKNWQKFMEAAMRPSMGSDTVPKLVLPKN